jgi:predicted nucleic acid-binding Zn ribbon protein
MSKAKSPARSPGKGPGKGPEKVGELLGSFLEKKGLREALERVDAAGEWDERVGEAIGQVTKARGVSGTTLFVEVKSSPWLMELNLMKEEILDRVNQGRDQGLIERIVFVLAEQ